MQVKSIKGRSVGEIQQALEAYSSADFAPTLAIVFAPPTLDLKVVADTFAKKRISVFGASAFGNFIDRDYEKESIVAMLLDINPKHFRILFRETGDSTTKAIAQSIGEEGKSAFDKPAFIVASGGLTTDGDMIVEGILEGAGKDTMVFGALSSANMHMKEMKTMVFSGGKTSEDGIVALVLDAEKININGLAVGGWKPVGMFRTVTKSEGNVVYTIDDLPALDTVLRYSGADSNKIQYDTNILALATAFQLQLHRENASPIMRTPMYANLENKSIVFAGTVPQGSKVKFSLLPGFEVIDNLIDEYQEFHKEVSAADAVIVFSCQGREIALGPWISDEIERLQQIWNSPLVGFFSFGEIGKDKSGKCEFYNMTCSLALLKEV